MLVDDLEEILNKIKEVQENPKCIGFPMMHMSLFNAENEIEEAVKLAKEMSQGE